MISSSNPCFKFFIPAIFHLLLILLDFFMITSYNVVRNIFQNLKITLQFFPFTPLYLSKIYYSTFKKIYKSIKKFDRLFSCFIKFTMLNSLTRDILFLYFLVLLIFLSVLSVYSFICSFVHLLHPFIRSACFSFLYFKIKFNKKESQKSIEILSIQSSTRLSEKK